MQILFELMKMKVAINYQVPLCSSLLNLKLLSSFIILLSIEQTTVNSLLFGCPSSSLIRPCVCDEKSKGLDLTCQGATLDQLKESFDSISQNQAVSYLKIMNSTNLRVLPNYLLEGIKISHLICHHNNLQLIEQDAFITTSNNQLNPTDLLSIDLSFNKLKKVPTSSFRTLNSLISLNLNYNEIEYIDEYAFAGLVSLLRLSIFGNLIKQINANAFTGIGGNLTRINLGGNQLDRVPSQTLHSLETLNRLNLNENKIKSLESDFFVNFIASDTLDTLILNKNQIKVIPDRAFKYLVGLSSLEIANNEISSIQEDAFFQIEESLEWLKLAENRLREIPSKALKNLTKLRLLDVRSNNITYIEKKAFSNFGKTLKFLYLQSNRIMVIEDGAFDNLTSLEWLYLSSNHLYTISPKLFSPLVAPLKLKVLDIHSNPFICNCELGWISDLISKESTILNLPKQTKCKLNIINLSNESKTDLVRFSKKLNQSFISVLEQHRDYLNQMAIKKKLASDPTDNKEEISLSEMSKCSSGQRVATNYKYHLYCLVLSFILIHIIYYYFGYFFI